MDESTLLSGEKKEDVTLLEIDKQIQLRFMKEKRTSRTYIRGLADFLDNEKLTKFVTSLKKRLGTGMIECEQDGKIAFGFQGDHRSRIEEIIVSELQISKTKIKK